MLRTYLVNALVETKYRPIETPESHPHEMLVAIIKAM
jgi:hypothetical protein